MDYRRTLMDDTQERTIEEVRKIAYAALAEALGPADTIRFLQTMSTGSGDYTAERRQQIVESTVREMAAEIMKSETG